MTWSKTLGQQSAKEWDRKEWRDAEPRIAAIFTAFLKTRRDAE